MSKVLEALRRKPETPAPRPENREIRIDGSSREWTQEQLAEVYFSAVGKPKTAEPPVILRVIEQPKRAAYVPWLITTVAFLITAAALFSSKRLLVDVRVIDDKTLLISTEGDVQLSPQSGTDKIVPAGDTLPLESFSFEGGALLQSTKDARRLTLVNSSVAPFSRAVLRPSEPLNMSRAKLMFEARGARGGENLGVAIKDRGNVQGFKKGVVRPFSGGLTTEWAPAEIVLVDTNDHFDPKNVASIRFEFGSKDTANRSGDTIYVRNLRLAPLG